MFKKHLLISLFVFSGITNSALAETVSGDVKAGKATLIYNYAQYDPELCSGMAVPKVGKVKAGNGKITTRVSSQKLQKAPCTGKSIKAVSVFYTPDRGFRGKDKASVVFLLPIWNDGTGHQAKRVKFNLNVK